MSEKIANYRPARLVKPAQLRPRKNEKAAGKRWNPTDWRPEYEQIVALSCRGLSNIYIAEQFNLTPQHVSNILNCNEGKAIQFEFINGIRNYQEEYSKKSIGESTDKAISRIHEMFNNDELFASSPFGVTDRAVGFLKAIGKFQNDAAPVANQTNNTTVILKQETILNQLNVSLDRATEARRLNSGVSGDSVN